jgi:hypothetical protein
MTREQFRKILLMDGKLTILERLYLPSIAVNNRDVVAKLGETCASNAANIARPDDCNLHLSVP